MMHSLNFRRFLVTASAFAGGIAILCFTGFFAFRYVRENARLLGEAERELAALEAVRAGTSRARGAYERLRAERGAIQAAFADRQDPLAVIEAVEALGRSVGVAVELAVAPGGDGQDRYRLAASGPLARAFTFLRALERAPFFLQFDDVRIVRAQRPGDAKAPGSYVRLSLSFSPVVP